MSELLAKKLRLKAGQKITVLHCPERAYFSEFEISEEFPEGPVELIVLFVQDLEELKEKTESLIESNAICTGGRLLIAYPKKGNRIFDTYVHRDHIFPALGVDEGGYIGNSSYKFNQMVKLDDNYTIVGIKHEKNRKYKKAASQCVDDYKQYVPAIEKELADEAEALAFFQSLTPGYQKNWARYIYSAKGPDTRKKRIEEMIGLLRQRVKSKELARS